MPDLALGEIDLHGLPLYEAEYTICTRLEEAWFCGEKSVLLVHGYKGGTAIRDFIRNDGRLRKKFSRSFPELPEISICIRDRGSTYVKFKG